MVLLEEGAKKLLNLTGLKRSIWVDEHNVELLFQEILVLCSHVRVSNEQLVHVREAGRAAWGEAGKQAAHIVLGSWCHWRL